MRQVKPKKANAKVREIQKYVAVSIFPKIRFIALNGYNSKSELFPPKVKERNASIVNKTDRKVRNPKIHIAMAFLIGNFESLFWSLHQPPHQS